MFCLLFLICWTDHCHTDILYICYNRFDPNYKKKLPRKRQFVQISQERVVQNKHLGLLETRTQVASWRKLAFITHIPMIPSDLPFQFKYLQFPQKVFFTITKNSINYRVERSNVHELDLSSDCFSFRLYTRRSIEQ